jgi:hypothetical protein
MYCFMFHFDLIVPDPADRKVPQIRLIKSKQNQQVPAGGRAVAGSNPVSPTEEKYLEIGRKTRRPIGVEDTGAPVLAGRSTVQILSLPD